MKSDYFYTFNEYMKNNGGSLTASMEDYMEMIYRLSSGSGFTRVHEVSQALNVQPPSATKMVQRLAQLKLLKYEKYGFIILEEKGKRVGEGLLTRHQIVEKFMRAIGVDSRDILTETEKIEHTLSPKTTKCITNIVEFMESNTDIAQRYKSFCILRNNKST